MSVTLWLWELASRAYACPCTPRPFCPQLQHLNEPAGNIPSVSGYGCCSSCLDVWLVACHVVHWAWWQVCPSVVLGCWWRIGTTYQWDSSREPRMMTAQNSRLVLRSSDGSVLAQVQGVLFWLLSLCHTLLYLIVEWWIWVLNRCIGQLVKFGVVSRVQHGYGNTCGVWVSGCAGTGTVFEIPTHGYTVTHTYSSMGIHGYNQIWQVLPVFLLTLSTHSRVLGWVLWDFDYWKPNQARDVLERS